MKKSIKLTNDYYLSTDSLAQKILYSSSSSDGAITLNDDITNYKYIKVHYFLIGSKGCKEIISPKVNDKFIIQDCDLDTPSIRFFYTTYQITNERTITPITTNFTYINSNNVGTYTDANYVRIFRVIGYK